MAKDKKDKKGKKIKKVIDRGYKKKSKAQVKKRKERIARDKARSKTGSDYFKFENGQTLFYVCPAVYEADEAPYIEGAMCFSIGPDGKRSAGSFAGQGDNEALVAAVKKQGLSWDEAEEGFARLQELSDSEGNSQQTVKKQWWINIVVLGTRSKRGKPWDEPEAKVSIVRCSQMVFNGIADILFDEADIENPDEAIFLVCTREGKDKGTKYAVAVDTDSLKDPVQLSDEIWSLVSEACQPGKSGDMYANVARTIKSEAQIDAIWYGEDEDEAPARRKSTKVSTRGRRSSLKDDDADDDEPEEKPKKSKKSKGKKKLKHEEIADAATLDRELNKRILTKKKKGKKKDD